MISTEDTAVSSNTDTSVPSTQEIIDLINSSLPSQVNLADDNPIAEDNSEHNDTDTINVALKVSEQTSLYDYVHENTRK